MARANLGEIEIEYDEFGDPSDPTYLLVMGLGSQLIHWEEGFCRMLADRGYRVVRYDNRDVGLSTWFDDLQVDVMDALAAVAEGREIEVPYSLADMAADGMGLLDHLGVDRAHVAGISMGGMIVQRMAIHHPDRLLSATSIMSTTGDRDVGTATQEAMSLLVSPPPANADEAAEQAARATEVFGSPVHADPDRARIRARAAYERANHPAGMARQLVSILGDGSRTAELGEVSVPFQVIHGRADTLVSVSGGIRTAEAVEGADLLLLDDMSHDLPEPLWPAIVGALAGKAARATEAAS
ncbi:MAG TPA: alpha/beta hydrolase [Acidimicrobiales bacterium]|nr:alpha/beta hydrolase [Acidimicrobiales bacterium]